jgi:hypothetical protein
VGRGGGRGHRGAGLRRGPGGVPGVPAEPDRVPGRAGRDRPDRVPAPRLCPAGPAPGRGRTGPAHGRLQRDAGPDPVPGGRAAPAPGEAGGAGGGPHRGPGRGHGPGGERQQGQERVPGHHQRHPGLLPDRGRPDGAGAGALPPARDGGGDPGDPGLHGPGPAPGPVRPGGRGRAGLGGGGPGPAAPGAGQPGGQCAQVHRGRGSGGAGVAGLRGRRRPPRTCPGGGCCSWAGP